jgi:acyl-coenzyme A thioesterase PaaI-like protein
MMHAQVRRSPATRAQPNDRKRAVPAGLQFDITIDDADPKRCVATLILSDAILSIPGSTRGGLLFTAMERLAARVPTLLRDDASNVWLLQTASITHYRAVRPDRPIDLTGVIGWDSAAGEPIVIHAEATDSAGGLLAEADFTIVPVPVRRFCRGALPALAPAGSEVGHPLEPEGRAD